jgi:hypothetical protein
VTVQSLGLRALIGVGLALVALVAMPAAAWGCQSEEPGLKQVLEGSHVVVVGIVASGVQTDSDLYPDRFTIEVERTLRGRARASITIESPAGLCGDGLGPAHIGQRLIIADGMRFYGQRLAPFWWTVDGQLVGWASLPSWVTTLDELVEHIDALPDTATEDLVADSMTRAGLWPLAPIGLLAVLLFLRRPIARPKAS